MSQGTLRVLAYLDHILLAIRRIGRYTKALTEEGEGLWQRDGAGLACWEGSATMWLHT